MVAHLLSKGDECPVKCGVIAHPAPDSSKWPGFTKPNEWHLASGDLFITDSVIASLQQLMDEKKKSIGIEFEYTLYPGGPYLTRVEGSLTSRCKTQLTATQSGLISVMSRHVRPLTRRMSRPSNSSKSTCERCKVTWALPDSVTNELPSG